MIGRIDAGRGKRSPNASKASLGVSASWLLAGCFSLALLLQTTLENAENFATVGSALRWRQLVEHLGQSPSPDAADRLSVVVPVSSLLARLMPLGIGIWGMGSLLIARSRKQPLAQSSAAWGRSLGRWFCIPAVWEIVRLAGFLFGADSLVGWLIGVIPLAIAVSLAGALTALLSLAFGELETQVASPTARQFRIVVVAAVGYFVTFTAMNWQLYHGLLVPHGDTAMYEEHLWNLLHGKGFRSYLDQGLFLGEHLQVIHALLIPVYWFWPSHLVLELCSSLALASGAVATFFLGLRHSGSAVAAKWLAIAYLLAIPMQFLDIAIDLKTFRPTSFVIPLLLFALDQMERGRFRTMAALLMVTLSAQEDLALIVGPLGFWVAFNGWKESRLPSAGTISDPTKAGTERRRMRWGLGILLFSAVYLVLALVVVIPWFRQGHEVHYTSYFGELGSSPGQIVRTMFARPSLVLAKLFSFRTLSYLLLLLLPYGMLPVRGGSRLLVALPLFAALCLMDTSRDPAKEGVELLLPFHHFHAPIVPILVWSAAAGLGGGKSKQETEASHGSEYRARFAFGCALATGLFYSLSPIGLSFWDPGSSWYFERLYVPGPRAAHFQKVLDRIPTTARVASTDFVHPRFTHFERSYDYSHFRRSVAGYGDSLPRDTEFIVIDTHHPYSDIQTVEQMREWKNEREQWELLPDVTEGYYLVLKRRTSSQPESP